MKKNLFILLALIFVACNSTEKKEINVVVTNPSDFDRPHEIVEIAWDSVRNALSLTDAASVIVLDSAQQQQVLYQIVNEEDNENAKLIFLAGVKANGTTTYQIKTGTPEKFGPMVYGRLVPERKDDFAWENNRIAFRIYGPALEATGEISNGLDLWVKSTDSLVIDKWYKNDLAGVASYHEDHGEGLDMYKVGRTLGLGMTAPFVSDTLCLGNNFTEYTVLDNGPLRITFQLNYKPYDAGGKTINETRIIQLDAYNNLNKVTNTFETDPAAEMQLATGIVMIQDQPAITFTEPADGIMAYELPSDTVNGTIYTGVINPSGFSQINIALGHLLGINQYKAGNPYAYYPGGGGTKGGFGSFDDWIAYLKQQKTTIDQPLKVAIK